jgi:hypothetical protein
VGESLTVVTTSKDKRTHQAVEAVPEVRLVVCDDYQEGGDSFNKGNLLNAALDVVRPKDWVLFFDADILLPIGLQEWFHSRILNPGVLYYTSRFHSTSIDQMEKIRQRPELIDELRIRSPGADRFPWGYFQLWNVRAKAIRDRMPLPVGTMWPTAGSVDNHFMRQWPLKKRVRIDLGNSRRLSCIHIWHGDFTSGWHGGVDVGSTKWKFCGQVNHSQNGMYYFDGQLPKSERWIKLARTDTGEQVVFWWRTGDPDVMIDKQRAKYKSWGFFNGRCIWDSRPIKTVQIDVYSIETLPEADNSLIVGAK